MLQFLRRALASLVSMQTALLLLVLIALAAILGSFIPHSEVWVFGSLWFNLLLGSLVLTAAWCSWRQLRHIVATWQQRQGQRLRSLAVWGIHVSIVALGLAGLVAGLFFSVQRADLSPGESMVLPEGRLVLETLAVERDAGAAVADWVAVFSLTPVPAAAAVATSQRLESRVNAPASRGDLKILFANYRLAYDVELVLPTGQSSRIRLEPGRSVGLTKDGRISFILVPAESAGQPDAVVLSDGRELNRAHLQSGIPLALVAGGPQLRLGATVESCSLILRRTPGLWLLWLAFGLLSISVCGLFLGKGSRV